MDNFLSKTFVRSSDVSLVLTDFLYYLQEIFFKISNLNFCRHKSWRVFSDFFLPLSSRIWKKWRLKIWCQISNLFTKRRSFKNSFFFWIFIFISIFIFLTVFFIYFWNTVNANILNSSYSSSSLFMRNLCAVTFYLLTFNSILF